MIPVWIAAAWVALCVTALLVGERRGLGRQAAIAKISASIGFVALGAWLAVETGGVLAMLVLAGLAFGAVGDGLLLGKAKTWFLAGIGAFLIGHLLYVVAMVPAPPHGPLALWAWLPAAAVAAGAASWLWPHVGKPMRIPVGAYVLTIGVMLAVAWGKDIGWQMTLGASLFAASDLLVARQRFIVPSFWNRAIGLPLYYAGQLLIASAIPVFAVPSL